MVTIPKHVIYAAIGIGVCAFSGAIVFNLMWLRVNEVLPKDKRLPYYGYDVSVLYDHYRNLYPKGYLNAMRLTLNTAAVLLFFYSVASVVLLVTTPLK